MRTLSTSSIHTRNYRLPTRRPCTHLPRRRLILQPQIHGRREGSGSEARVEPGAREDGAAACATRFEVGRGEGGEGGGCWEGRES
jgi:hypothetical protein